MNIINTKSDQAFKIVFGEKPHLLISLLNNLLPLQHPIVSIEYLTPEISPELKDGKNSIVDVRCTDNHGRHFIVEMQIGKQAGFVKRVILNTTKVYSRQLLKDKRFALTQPVYSLNLLDHTITNNNIEWYHHYSFSNRNDHSDIWEDIQIIFIELPKWKKRNKFDLTNPKDRWLMYFTKPDAFDRLSKEERAKYNDVCEAMDTLIAQNCSIEKLIAYENYIDGVNQYITTMEHERQEGMLEGVNISLQIVEALKKNIETSEQIASRLKVDLALVTQLKQVL
jgi:predicted transposase/invertase (TIGR01784 family)